MALFGFGGKGQHDGPEAESPPPSEEPEGVQLLRAAPFVSYRLADANEALDVGGDQLPQPVAGFFADVLRRCRSFETLDDHVAWLSEELRFDRAAAASLRESLVDAADTGLLVSLESVYQRIAARSASGGGPVSISTVGLVTRDRPECLERALRSYMEHARTHGRTMSFVVCDDTEDSGQAERCAEGAGMLGDEFGFEVYYAGPAEKRAYAGALARELGTHVAGAEELARFSLGGVGGIDRNLGANRNALHLHCAGDVYFSSDDDIVCRLAAVDDARDELRLSSTDPTELWFFPSVADALEGSPLHDVDLWKEHERLLGRGLDQVVASQPSASSLDLGPMGDDLFRRLLAGRSSVGVTSTGVAGDSGMGKAHYMLFLGGETLVRLLEDEDAYEWACSTRAVRRGAPCPTVSDGSHLMAGALALDGRAVLPPFMPVLRNADGVFVEALRACLPDTLVGHVPWTVRHEPPEGRAFAEDDVVKSISALRTSEYVVRWSRQCGFGPGEREAEHRFAALGRHFQALGRLPWRDLEELLVREQRAYLSELGVTLEYRLASVEMPDAMARDAERCMQHIEACITGKASAPPVDLAEGRSAQEAVVLFGRLLGDYGRLLESWPAIVEAAGTLRQRGIRPGRRLE